MLWKMMLSLQVVMQGAPGQALSARDMQGMQAFLSAANPRVRAMGGTRFDGASEPSPEWQAFGSFCFMIPAGAAGSCRLLPAVMHSGMEAQLGPRGQVSIKAHISGYMLCLLELPACHFARLWLPGP